MWSTILPLMCLAEREIFVRIMINVSHKMKRSTTTKKTFHHQNDYFLHFVNHMLIHYLSPKPFFMTQPYLLIFLQDNLITPLFDQRPIGCETMPTFKYS